MPPFEIDPDEWGAGRQGSRPFVERFFRYWDEHRSLLTARHLAIMSGDRRFQEVADDAFRPVATALQDQIVAAQRAGRVAADLEPVALAAVLNLMIDVAGMAAPALQPYWDATDEAQLVDAVSFVFDRVLALEPGAS